MRRIARRTRSPIFIALVVALVAGGATAAAAPTAVTSVVKFAKRAGFAKKAGKANRASYATRAGSARKAGSAKKATFAVSAGVAGDSSQLGGHPASEYARGPSNQKLDFRAKASTGETALLDTGKLVISASCDGTGHVRVLGTTKIDHAAIETFGNGGDVQDDDFTIGGSPVNLGPTQGEHRSLIYTEPGGQTVELEYLTTDKNISHGGVPLGGAVDCLVTGFAIVQ
jgi:hypothetical protein